MVENTDKPHAIVMAAKDLPLHCPPPGAPLWPVTRGSSWTS